MTVVALVSVGFGIGFVAHSATHLRLPNVAYVPLADAPVGLAGLDCIYLRGNDSPVLGAFLQTLKQCATEIKETRRGTGQRAR